MAWYSPGKQMVQQVTLATGFITQGHVGPFWWRKEGRRKELVRGRNHRPLELMAWAASSGQRGSIKDACCYCHSLVSRSTVRWKRGRLYSVNYYSQLAPLLSPLLMCQWLGHFCPKLARTRAASGGEAVLRHWSLAADHSSCLTEWQWPPCLECMSHTRVLWFLSLPCIAKSAWGASTSCNLPRSFVCTIRPRP